MENSESKQTLTCGVTGSRGYVGSVLVAVLRNAGARVIELTRRPEMGNAEARRFQFGESTPLESLRGIDLLIHCAYDFTAFGWKQIHAVNVGGTEKLFADAARSGVKRFVLISSISAFEGCRSQYGKAKLEMENIARRYNAIVVRPGLVYGAELGGMMGSLDKLAGLVITPMLGSGRVAQYTAHEEDISKLILYLAGNENYAASGPITAANESPQTLRQIMTMLAKSRGKKARFVSVPPVLVGLGLRMLEGIGLRPRMRSDSLVSLLNQNPRPDFSSLRATGISFRPLAFPARQ